MAKVQVVDVAVLDNPSAFLAPFKFQITFDCLENLSDDLEWKIIYVGSAESEHHDQTLDSVLVGPVPAGRHKFVFEADHPQPNLLPLEDAVGVTVVMLTCTYHENEFVRIGYYVNNEYSDVELRETPPSPPDFEKLCRSILDSAPRVTRFKINWDGPNAPGTEETGQEVQENVPPMDDDSPSMLDDSNEEFEMVDELNGHCQISRDDSYLFSPRHQNRNSDSNITPFEHIQNALDAAAAARINS